VHCADYWQSYVPEVKLEANKSNSMYAPSASIPVQAESCY